MPDDLPDEERHRLRAATEVGLPDTAAHFLRGDNYDEILDDALELRAQLARAAAPWNRSMNNELRTAAGLSRRHRAGHEIVSESNGNGANHV